MPESKPKRVKRGLYDNAEHAIQAAYVTWVRYLENRLPELKLGFAVPNGGLRDPRTAMILQREGVRPGVPDYLYPVPAAGFNGLALEFKTKTGALSEAQKAYRDLLVKQRWRYEVVRGWTDAREITLEYFGYSLVDCLHTLT